jgi:hypothetical protein
MQNPVSGVTAKQMCECFNLTFQCLAELLGIVQEREQEILPLTPEGGKLAKVLLDILDSCIFFIMIVRMLPGDGILSVLRVFMETRTCEAIPLVAWHPRDRN